jgi:hypothetical protein
MQVQCILLILWAIVCTGSTNAARNLISTDHMHSDPSVNNEELDKLWKPLININENCPRFVYVNTGVDGMGDQLERLSMGLAMVHSAASYDTANPNTSKGGFTLVVSDDWENVEKSLHKETAKGYHSVYVYLSVPLSLCLSISLSLYLSVSLCLSVSMSLCLYFILTQQHFPLFPLPLHHTQLL